MKCDLIIHIPKSYSQLFVYGRVNLNFFCRFCSDFINSFQIKFWQ